MLDVEALKAPIAGATPVGPEMRGEVEFGEIEEAVRSFGTMTPGELKKVVTRCGALFALSKDQTPAIIALEASARIGDLAEMRAALALIEHLIADHWEDYHPGPAEEMAEARINELAALKRRAALLLPFSKLALAKLPGPGDIGFTADMVRVAAAPVEAWSKDDENKLKEMVEKGNATKIDADNQKLLRERARMLRFICRSISEPARLLDAESGVNFDGMAEIADAATIAQGVLAQIKAVRAPLTSIGDALYTVDEAVESKLGRGPGLGTVANEVYAMVKSCDAFVEAFAPPPAVVAEEAEDAGAPAATGAAAAAAPKPVMALSVESVRSRADVITAMDAIIRYYVENEPSSPVPLMLRRVRGWVNKEFLDVMKDILPATGDELVKLLVPRDS